MSNATKRQTASAAALAVLSTLLIGMTPQVKAADQLTAKQAKALAATAKTSADHKKLAAYFALEADRLEAEAKEHEELAQNYRLNPSMSGGGKAGGGSQGRTYEHCEATAKSLREAAKSTRELAAEHEQMAKDASK